MKVKQIMTTQIETIDVGATVLDAAECMSRRNVGCLPVMLDDGIIGFVTDRDIVVRAIARGRDAAKTPIADVMTRGAAVCGADWEIKDAVGAMQDGNVRRLAVLDEDGQLCGMLSLDDLAARAHDAKAVEMVLEQVAARPNPAGPSAGQRD